jgi:hypothetical protein
MPDEDELDRELRSLAAGESAPPTFVELSAAERAARAVRAPRPPRQAAAQRAWRRASARRRSRSSGRSGRLARLTSRPVLIVAGSFLVLCAVAYGLSWLSSH